MRSWLFALAVVVAGMFGAGEALAQSLGLARSYAVAGKNVDGSSYSGTANVRVVSDTTIAITWRTGGTSFTGFGMRWGETFAVSYEGAGLKGVAMYQVDRATGVFSGRWTILGQNGVGTEVLTPQN